MIDCLTTETSRWREATKAKSQVLILSARFGHEFAKTFFGSSEELVKRTFGAKSLRSAWAAEVDDAGFCPVTSRPSTIEKRLPVARLSRKRPETQQFVFNEERHYLGELHFFLFAVGKAGHPLSLYERLALVSDMAERTGRVADQRDWLAGVVKGLEQGDGIGIFGQIPHRAVSTRIENRIKIFRFHGRELHRVSKRMLCGFIFLETRCCGRLIFRQIALRIERWLAALGDASVSSTPASRKTK